MGTMTLSAQADKFVSELSDEVAGLLFTALERRFQATMTAAVAAVDAAMDEPVAPSKKYLPGKFAPCKGKGMDKYQEKIPPANLKVGAVRSGVKSTKPNAASHKWEVAVAKDGSRFWKFVS